MAYSQSVKKRLHRTLDAQGLTYPEFLVLDFIGTVAPLDPFPHWGSAIEGLKQFHCEPSFTEKSLTESVHQLLAKGLTQVCTNDVLNSIKANLRCQGVDANELIGGFAQSGQIDLTEEGGRIFLHVYDAVFNSDKASFGEANGPPCSAVLQQDSSEPIVISNSRTYAEQGVYAFISGNPGCWLIECAPVEPIGRWYMRWWWPCAEGWVIKMKVQWHNVR